MTVPAQTPVSTHVGNGVTTSFAYGFKLLDQADIEVSVDGVLKTLTTDYSVTGVGVDAGGTIVFVAAPASLADIALVRNVPVQRLTDYQYSGDFQSPTVNRDFDRIVMMLQDSGVNVANALRFPLGDTASGVLPGAADRALKGLAFDADGEPFLSTAAGDANALDAQLASIATAALGGGKIGYSAALAYAAGTAGKGIKDAAADAATGIANAATAQGTANAATTNINTFKADVLDASDIAKGAALMGYKLNRAGSVGRNLLAKLDELKSVREFGAVGDGVTDDTAAFQAAYAATKYILIPEGTYLITGVVGSLVDNAGPRFVGRGASVSKLLMGAAASIHVSGRSWQVTGLGFVANAVVACALRCGEGEANEQSEISNCHFVSDSAVSEGASQKYFTICCDMYRMWYSRIVDNTFRNGFYSDRFAGIGLKFHYSVNLSIRGNSFACFEYGLQWTTDQYLGTYQCEGHVIADNIFVVNKVHLSFLAGLLPTVTGNVIDLTKSDGTPLESFAPCTIITGNWIAGQTPAILRDADRHVVSNNVFDGTAASGVALNIENSDYGQISGNIFRSYAQAITANAGCSSWIVSGNNMVSQATAAVNLSLVGNLVYTENLANGGAEILPGSSNKTTWATSSVVNFGASATVQQFFVAIPSGVFPSTPVVVAMEAENQDLVCCMDFTASTATSIRVLARKRDGSSFSGGYRFSVIAHAA